MDIGLFSFLSLPFFRTDASFLLPSFFCFRSRNRAAFLFDPMLLFASRDLNKSGDKFVQAVFNFLLLRVSPRFSASASPVHGCIVDVYN